MSYRSRLEKQYLRSQRGVAAFFLEDACPAAVMSDLRARENAVNLPIPEGYEKISNKKRVAFRLPKARELFVNTDGVIDRAAFPFTNGFGMGARWIVRKQKRG